MKNIYRKPLHLSIASMQTREFNLTNELLMLKAALVYGDKVDIRSIASSMIMANVLHLVRSREEWYEDYPKDEVDEFINTANEHLEIEGVREFIDICYGHSDIVEFLMFGADSWAQVSDLPEPPKVETAMMLDFAMQLSEDFYSGNTIPFFDDAASSLANKTRIIGSKIGFPILPKSPIVQSKQIAIVSNLFSRLPLFERAQVDEIFDIRKELEKPLVNFRSQIIQVSKEIETAPWDKDFPLDVEQLFIEKVEPTILDIEDACKSNKLLSSVISNIAKKPLVIPATSALGLVLSTSAQIPDVIAQAISLSTGVAIIASEAIKEWKEKQKEIERNGFYFYYKLGNRFLQPRKTISQRLRNLLPFLRRWL